MVIFNKWVGYRTGCSGRCHRQGAGGSAFRGGFRSFGKQAARRNGSRKEQKLHGFEVWVLREFHKWSFKNLIRIFWYWDLRYMGGCPTVICFYHKWKFWFRKWRQSFFEFFNFYSPRIPYETACFMPPVGHLLYRLH